MRVDSACSLHLLKPHQVTKRFNPTLRLRSIHRLCPILFEDGDFWLARMAPCCIDRSESGVFCESELRSCRDIKLNGYGPFLVPVTSTSLANTSWVLLTRCNAQSFHAHAAHSSRSRRRCSPSLRHRHRHQQQRIIRVGMLKERQHDCCSWPIRR